MGNGKIEMWPGEVPPQVCMGDVRFVEGFDCFCEQECERRVRGYEIELSPEDEA